MNESFDLHKLYPILENLPSLKFPGHRFGIEGRKRIVLWAPGGQTRPDKPHSGKQGYRLTVKGRQWLNDRSGDRI
ncbi:MAG: hypothetical protein LBR95_01355 [Azoarcus sp.]|nr:hypothetical protein [Azoarcus sp.]